MKGTAITLICVDVQYTYKGITVTIWHRLKKTTRPIVPPLKLFDSWHFVLNGTYTKCFTLIIYPNNDMSAFIRFSHFNTLF